MSAAPGGSSIIRCGPYRFMRHPMYTAALLLFVWTAVVSHVSVLTLAIGIAVTVVCHSPSHRRGTIAQREVPRIPGTTYDPRKPWCRTCSEQDGERAALLPHVVQATSSIGLSCRKTLRIWRAIARMKSGGTRFTRLPDPLGDSPANVKPSGKELNRLNS